VGGEDGGGHIYEDLTIGTVRRYRLAELIRHSESGLKKMPRTLIRALKFLECLNLESETGKDTYSAWAKIL
jgi:hypothetical protein